MLQMLRLAGVSGDVIEGMVINSVLVKEIFAIQQHQKPSRHMDRYFHLQCSLCCGIFSLTNANML